MRHLEHEIKGLAKGNKYFIRVAACNMKGYSGYTVAKPAYAVPSSELPRLKHFFYIKFFESLGSIHVYLNYLFFFLVKKNLGLSIHKKLMNDV